MKQKNLFFTALTAITLSLSISLHAQENESPGVKVGEKAPAFELKDQNGKAHSLESLLKNKELTALTFHRSADWCPFCKRQLAEIQTNIKKYEDAGIQMVAISYDSVEILERFATSEKISYTLLSDEGSKTIDAYGIRNKENDSGIPHPGTFIVNSEGVIIAKLFHDGYRERFSSDEIIAAAKKASVDSE